MYIQTPVDAAQGQTNDISLRRCLFFSDVRFPVQSYMGALGKQMATSVIRPAGAKPLDSDLIPHLVHHGIHQQRPTLSLWQGNLERLGGSNQLRVAVELDQASLRIHIDHDDVTLLYTRNVGRIYFLPTKEEDGHGLFLGEDPGGVCVKIVVV